MIRPLSSLDVNGHAFLSERNLCRPLSSQPGMNESGENNKLNFGFVDLIPLLRYTQPLAKKPMWVEEGISRGPANGWKGVTPGKGGTGMKFPSALIQPSRGLIFTSSAEYFGPN